MYVYLGPLLSERYFDLKVVICWSHSFIRRHMKQKYLKRVEDIRVTHRDIANYFLESFIESKPLVDMTRNIQLRYSIINISHSVVSDNLIYRLSSFYIMKKYFYPLKKKISNL
jgi:hypothetical protein